MPKLLDHVRACLRVRHYSYRTEKAYAHWIKRFILFHHKRHPGEMGAPEVTAFHSLPRYREAGRNLDTESGALSPAVPVSRGARAGIALAHRR